jgi:hypothetical protein
MKTKTLQAKDPRGHVLNDCPNFSRSGSITGMKQHYYGKQAKLLRYGSWIYHCTKPKAEALYDSLP